MPRVGEIMGECTGKILFNTTHKFDMPKTGDWVFVQYFEDENKALIHEILERRKVLSRKVAGNVTDVQIIATHVDKVFIVQGLDSNFNLNRLIRTVVLVRECGTVPIIVLNKTDLVDDLLQKIHLIEKSLHDVAIIVALNALYQHDVTELMHFMNAGETFVLMGSSGVGKSTLANRLTGYADTATGAVREADAKGRHTTTRREMYLLSNGGILIDTPSTRELQLMSASEGLEVTFDAIYELAKHCRYSDCSHEVEKGCAVLEALEEGEISSTEYQNFLKLKRENAHMQAKTDQKAFLEQKVKDKQLHKHIRAVTKGKKFR